MNPFKSPTRRRAEKMIDVINQKRTDIVMKRQKNHHMTEEFSKSIPEEERLDVEARVLRKLLRK